MSRKRIRALPEIKTGRIDEAMRRYSLGRDKTRSIAKDAGAVVKVGGVCLYDFEKMDAYIDKLRREM